MLHASDFDFELPPDRIAQQPAPARDGSRLLVLERATGQLLHRQFRDLPGFLRPNDVLVLNNSKVIPARLRAVNSHTGGEFEALLLQAVETNIWWAMMRPGKRARVGTCIAIKDLTGNRTDITATVEEVNSEGHRRLRFQGVPDILSELERLGETPLPPYISRDHETAGDRERYQTIYARAPGSVAAPTAGLHFTPDLLHEIRSQGVHITEVTLHVGLGTFAPVKTERLDHHLMHEERFTLNAHAADAIARAKAAGGRVVAVGTTSVRVLESVAVQNHGMIQPISGHTRIFIHPPYRFQAVDALVTNFHLPKSTLVMLVSAFAKPGETAGREQVLAAYQEAIREHYRFFSYGDAMLVL